MPDVGRQCFHGTARDITDRKRDEEAIRDREARLRAIFETAPGGIVTIDATGIVESFNPASEHMFGYAVGEVIDRNVKMLMPSPFSEEHDGNIADHLRTRVRKVIGAGREVAGRHGGSISVNSTPGRGTTFGVTLPVRRTAGV